MVRGGLNFFPCLLSLLSLSADQALARVSNITFLSTPTVCSPVTISWLAGVPPFTVSVLQVDQFAQPGPDGIIPGNILQAADTGNARRVVWTAAVVPGEVLIAVVRDGLNQNATSPIRVVQTSTNTTCLESVVCSFDLISLGRSDNENQQSSDTDASPDIVVPTLSIRPLGTSTTSTPTPGTPTIFISAATESPSEAPPTANQ
jgi:hypothetical protein